MKNRRRDDRRRLNMPQVLEEEEGAENDGKDADNKK